MGLPRLNLLCPAALQGFCYRALAGEAKASDAPLTARKLEDLQSAKTEVMLSLSALKSDIQIVRQRVISADKDAEETGLDLRIFNDENPLPPPRRGIFSKGLSLEQKELEAQRLELEQISEQCKKDLSANKDAATKLATKFEQQEKELSEVVKKQAELTLELSSQVAAEVIGKVIDGEADSARRKLFNLRQMSRGNLMLGVLSVIVELLADGPGAARNALADARLIFEQHPDPAEKVLNALIEVADGKSRLDKDLGLITYQKFTSHPLYLLSQMTNTLGGYYPDDTVLGDTLFFGLLVGLHESLGFARASEAQGGYPEDEQSEMPLPKMDDLVAQTLVCSTLLLPQKRSLLLPASGATPTDLNPSGNRHQSFPSLLDIIKRHDCPEWPKTLKEPWQVALACFALLGAKQSAPLAIFEQWLDESYNWPKCDLYWRVLAEIKQDKTLLRNISGKPEELFTVDPV